MPSMPDTAFGVAVEGGAHLSSLRGLLANRFARALMRSMSSGIGTLAIRLLSIALLSRLLAPEAFGYYFLGQFAALVIGTAGNLAYSYKVLEAGTVVRRDIWAWMVISAVLSGVILVVALASAELAARPGALGRCLVGGACCRRFCAFDVGASDRRGAGAAAFGVSPPLACGDLGDNAGLSHRWTAACADRDAAALVAAHWSYLLFKIVFILRYSLRHLPSVHDTAAGVNGASGRYSAFGPRAPGSRWGSYSASVYRRGVRASRGGAVEQGFSTGVAGRQSAAGTGGQRARAAGVARRRTASSLGRAGARRRRHAGRAAPPCLLGDLRVQSRDRRSRPRIGLGRCYILPAGILDPGDGAHGAARVRRAWQGHAVQRHAGWWWTPARWLDLRLPCS